MLVLSERVAHGDVRRSENVRRGSDRIHQRRRRQTFLAFALISSLGRADVERALSLARWPHTDAERARFHARYITRYKVPESLAGPAVESIEVITEFRRIELIAEGHAAANDMFARGGAIKEAEDALKPYRGRVSIVAHVQFGLLTIGSPTVTIVLTGGAEPAPKPIDAKMTPIFVRDALVAGDFDAVFSADSIGQAPWNITVTSNGAELARTRVDFRAIE
jgi:hypothetical protein